MVGFINSVAQIIIKIRWCVACKNHVARSKVKVTVSTSSFLGSKIVYDPLLHHAWSDLKIIWHKCSSRPDNESYIRTMSQGQQSALSVFGFKNRVRLITSSCKVGFKNDLAQIIITTRRCVACKNLVARSKVKVTVGT